MPILGPDRKAQTAVDVCGLIEIRHNMNDVIETARHGITYEFADYASGHFDQSSGRNRLSTRGNRFKPTLARAGVGKVYRRHLS
jgi:hypothetical protein